MPRTGTNAEGAYVPGSQPPQQGLPALTLAEAARVSRTCGLSENIQRYVASPQGNADDQRHNRDTSVDKAVRLEDYKQGWLPESVSSPIRPFKWVRVVNRIGSRTEHGMRCFPGTYMSDNGPTTMMPGDVCIVCTESKLLHCYIFMMNQQWYGIEHTPVAWVGNWASSVASILESWLGLPRTIKIFRACNEALSTFQDCINDNPELATDEHITEAIAIYERIKNVATSRTGSLTLPLIRDTITTLVSNLSKQACTDRKTVINLLGTVIEELSDNENLQKRKIIELRIEGLDQLVNAVLMIFGAKIHNGSAVTMLAQTLEAVQHNAGTLANWRQQTAEITTEAWQGVAQRPANRTRQLSRLNLRRRSTDANRAGVSTDNS